MLNSRKIATFVMFNNHSNMNAKQLVKRLETEGWRETRVRGSHRIFKHPEKTQTIVVPDHGSKDIATGTLNRILKDAGLK